MNKFVTLIIAAVLLMIYPIAGKAQDDPRPYNSLAESIARAIQEEFPDCKRTSVPTIDKDESNRFSEEAIIDQWKSDDAIIKVAVLIYPSKQDAVAALRKFTARARVNEYLPDVGNESYVWGIGKSVAFRKGRYAVYISTVPIEVPEGDAPMKLAVRPKETKYNKIFAHLIAKVLVDQ